MVIVLMMVFNLLPFAPEPVCGNISDLPEIHRVVFETDRPVVGNVADLPDAMPDLSWVGDEATK